MSRLMYVGQQVADDLRRCVGENLPRYKGGHFNDLEVAGDWRIPLSIEADLGRLDALNPDGRPESEIANSLLVGDVLGGLTPALARENRIWIRLSHIECLEYSRKRWLRENLNEEGLLKAISAHFFAPTLTRCRDDHAISRLWWNFRIARQLMPEAPERALNVILARADIRMHLVERPGIAARPALARGIVRALEGSEDLLRVERIFQVFMKTVNLRGAGVAFEVVSEEAVDVFLRECLVESRAILVRQGVLSSR